jgi:triosephosphate isomerase
MPRKFFVGGNWKCNLVGSEADKLVADLNAAMPLPEEVEVWRRKRAFNNIIKFKR